MILSANRTVQITQKKLAAPFLLEFAGFFPLLFYFPVPDYSRGRAEGPNGTPLGVQLFSGFFAQLFPGNETAHGNPFLSVLYSPWRAVRAAYLMNCPGFSCG